MGNCLSNSSSNDDIISPLGAAVPSGGGNTTNNNQQSSTTRTNIQRRPGNKLPRCASQQSVILGSKRISILTLAVTPDEYKKADPAKWKCQTYQCSGAFSTETKGNVQEKKDRPIVKAKTMFQENPSQYIAMFYPTEMLEWPANEQQYTVVERAGTMGFKPKGIKPNGGGQVTMLVNSYQQLPAFPQNELPKQYRDKYTDSVLATYKGKKLGQPPILPGRGMGLLDEPNLKMIGTIDPDDAATQGNVGDCWLLSAICALAEYEGAIRRLLRKTPQVDQMPFTTIKNKNNKGNMYTFTLWDLSTWKEVDVTVDERLCILAADGKLVGAKPSMDCELWVCYLEKALAAHCGGWDQINGGTCSQAWALLTGVKEQYLIQRPKGTTRTKGKKKKGWACWAKYNPETKEWASQANAPSAGTQGTWQVPWPKADGITSTTTTTTIEAPNSSSTSNTNTNHELDDTELFERMCAWDDANFLMAASTTGVSDQQKTNGMVDNHAYSIVDCQNDVAGITGMDLIQMRNPWGKEGSLESGMFVDNGPGWKRYPQIKKALQPVFADDGLFWLSKDEFFQYYESVYLSASNMGKFLGSSTSSSP